MKIFDKMLEALDSMIEMQIHQVEQLGEKYDDFY